jgi:hypothetical protein
MDFRFSIPKSADSWLGWRREQDASSFCHQGPAYELCARNSVKVAEPLGTSRTTKPSTFTWPHFEPPPGSPEAGFCESCRVLRVVGLLGLGGWDVADRLQESSVVEPIRPLERAVLDVVEALPRSAPADELRLVQPMMARALS